MLRSLTRRHEETAALIIERETAVTTQPPRKDTPPGERDVPDIEPPPRPRTDPDEPPDAPIEDPVERRPKRASDPVDQ